ncbi:hypothetical protein HG619_00465 [Pseudomonas syringae]|nr:hypothetical protein [Pseudomonas syringae]
MYVEAGKSFPNRRVTGISSMAKVVKAKYATHDAPCLKTTFGAIPAFTFAMSAKDLLSLHYVAVRGKDVEEGSVQRPLSIRRINGIRSYILDGNTFFNSFIINWTDKTSALRSAMALFQFHWYHMRRKFLMASID